MKRNLIVIAYRGLLEISTSIEYFFIDAEYNKHEKRKSSGQFGTMYNDTKFGNKIPQPLVVNKDLH